MTTRNASPACQHLALCQAVAIGEGAPEWVHLMPAGVSQTVNGTGPFVLDAAEIEAVIAASLKSSPDGKLVIDLNHSTDLAAPNGQPSPAQGWIEALEHRTDGLYGRVAWTDAGRTTLNGRAYRFISPVVTYARSTGKIIALLRASLTNNPNILSLKPVLNAAITETDMDLLKALDANLGLPRDGHRRNRASSVTALKSATTLNSGVIAKIARAAKLAEDADAETVVNAVTALADPSKMVPAATVTELQTALNTAGARIKSLEDGAARARRPRSSSTARSPRAASASSRAATTSSHSTWPMRRRPRRSSGASL